MRCACKNRRIACPRSNNTISITFVRHGRAAAGVKNAAHCRRASLVHREGKHPGLQLAVCGRDAAVLPHLLARPPHQPRLHDRRQQQKKGRKYIKVRVVCGCGQPQEMKRSALCCWPQPQPTMQGCVQRHPQSPPPYVPARLTICTTQTSYKPPSLSEPSMTQSVKSPFSLEKLYTAQGSKAGQVGAPCACR